MAARNEGLSERKKRATRELISNVLDLMRFESGAPVLRFDWETLDDLMAVARERCAARLDAHPDVAGVQLRTLEAAPMRPRSATRVADA